MIAGKLKKANKYDAMAKSLENGAPCVCSWPARCQIEVQLLFSVFKSIIIKLAERKKSAKSFFKKSKLN